MLLKYHAMKEPIHLSLGDCVQSLLAVDAAVYVQFLPTLLNQLFLLLTGTVREDVSLNIARSVYLVSSATT